MLAIFLLAGCNGYLKNDQTKIVRDQIGRFQIIGASADSPALKIDTVTGCITAIDRNFEKELLLKEITFPEGTNPCRITRSIPVEVRMETPAL